MEFGSTPVTTLYATLKGMIEPKDLSELAKQAEKGDADAQFGLGVVSHEGRGVVQSDETAKPLDPGL